MTSLTKELSNLKLEEKEEDSSSPKVSHYAESSSVTEGYITGKAVMALCGVVFVPSRDPQKFPICPVCKQIVDALFI